MKAIQASGPCRHGVIDALCFDCTLEEHGPKAALRVRWEIARNEGVAAVPEARNITTESEYAA